MCFGPVPSFAASAVLGAIGVATLSKVRGKREILLATFPLLFAIQQFNEGLLWLTIGKGDSVALQQGLTFIFLLFALVLWPIFSPLSFYLLEPDAQRRKVMGAFLTIGAIIGTYFLYYLLFDTYSATVIGYCITYDTAAPGSVTVLNLAYVLAVLATSLFSSYRPIVLLGLINIALCAITAIAFVNAHTSVWCFFAALWSSLLYLFFRRQRVDGGSLPKN